MPRIESTVRTLPRTLMVVSGETITDAMRRIDDDEIRAVCRHLLGDLAAPARRLPGRPSCR